MILWNSGKTLKNPEDILNDIGVKDGSTVMLLGKKVSEFTYLIK